MPSKDIFHSSANFHIVCSILGAVDICRGNIRAFHILSVGGAAHIWWSGLSTGRLLTILSNCVLTLTCSTQHFANTHLLHHSTLLNTLTHSLTKLAAAGKPNTLVQLFTSYCTGTGANMRCSCSICTNCTRCSGATYLASTPQNPRNVRDGAKQIKEPSHVSICVNYYNE